MTEAYSRWAAVNNESPFRRIPGLPARKRVRVVKAYSPNTRVEVRRYKNRKLYCTNTSRYISYKDIFGMLKSGCDVRVMAYPGGTDLTNWVMKAMLKTMIDQIEVPKEKMLQIITGRQRLLLGS